MSKDEIRIKGKLDFSESIRDTERELKNSLKNNQAAMEAFGKHSSGLNRKEIKAGREKNHELLRQAEELKGNYDGIFSSIEDMFTKSIFRAADRSAEKMSAFSNSGKKNIGDLGDNWGKSMKNISTAAESAFEGVGNAFAGAISKGMNIQDAARMMITGLLDTARKMILIYTPEIFGAFAALGPWGMPLGLAAITTMQALFATAKGSLGADEGVISIDEAYRKRPTSRDTIPIFVREGESILTPEFTKEHRSLLLSLYRGDSEESYFRKKYGDSGAENLPVKFGSIHEGSREQGLLQEIKKLQKINAALEKKLSDPIYVDAHSHISVSDKTRLGIDYKEMAWR